MTITFRTRFSDQPKHGRSPQVKPPIEPIKDWLRDKFNMNPKLIDQAAKRIVDRITQTPSKMIENNIDVKTYIAELADQAFKKTVISIAMQLQVEESEIKIRRSLNDFDDLIVIAKNEVVGHITISFVYDTDTLSNKVVVTFHQHAK